MKPILPDPDHTSAAQVSAYLERTLPGADRTRVEAHLAECGECRREVVEISRLLRARPRRLAIGRWAAAAGIAATLVLVVGRLPSGPTTPAVQPPGAVQRSGGPEEGPELSAWGPTEGVSISRDSLVLAWKPDARGSARYRLTLSNAEGAVLWTASTSDTMLIPPPSLILPGGRTYYWYTDALLPDGRSLSTGVQEFRLVP